MKRRYDRYALSCISLHQEPAAPAAGKASTAGFTLVELLLAATLGALVVGASAFAAGRVAQALDVSMSARTANALPALDRIVEDVRRAWWVEVPQPDRLEMHETLGGVTTDRHSDGDRVVPLDVADVDE